MTKKTDKKNPYTMPVKSGKNQPMVMIPTRYSRNIVSLADSLVPSKFRTRNEALRYLAVKGAELEFPGEVSESDL